MAKCYRAGSTGAGAMGEADGKRLANQGGIGKMPGDHLGGQGGETNKKHQFVAGFHYNKWVATQICSYPYLGK